MLPCAAAPPPARPRRCASAASARRRPRHPGSAPCAASSRDRLDQRLAVPDAGDDVVPAVGQQPGQALPQQHRILGDDHPHPVLHDPCRPRTSTSRARSVLAASQHRSLRDRSCDRARVRRDAPAGGRHCARRSAEGPRPREGGRPDELGRLRARARPCAAHARQGSSAVTRVGPAGRGVHDQDPVHRVEPLGEPGQPATRRRRPPRRPPSSTTWSISRFSDPPHVHRRPRSPARAC